MKRLVLLYILFLIPFQTFSSSGKVNFISGKNVYKNDKDLLRVNDTLDTGDKIICGPRSFCNLEFNDVKILMYPQTLIYLDLNLEKINNYRITIISQYLGKIEIESDNEVVVYTTDKIISFKDAKLCINIANKLTTVKGLDGLVNIYYKNNTLIYNTRFKILEEFNNPICSLVDDFYFNGVVYSERNLLLIYKKIKLKEEENE